MSHDEEFITTTFGKLEADPNGTDPKAGGAKLDAGKAPVMRGLLHYFPSACKQVALLSQVGADKYSWNGWESVPDGVNRYSDAMARHLLDEAHAYLDDAPGGTGMPHAVAVAWNAMARLELILREQNNGEEGTRVPGWTAD